MKLNGLKEMAVWHGLKEDDLMGLYETMKKPSWGRNHYPPPMKKASPRERITKPKMSDSVAQKFAGISASPLQQV